jgi:hypothetical protein
MPTTSDDPDGGMMKLIDRCRDRKIHTRNIEISTYEYDDEHIAVEGMPSEMIDHYLIDTCWVWRKDGPRVKMLKRLKRDAS